MPEFKVYKGTALIEPGHKLESFRGEPAEFVGCYHPRKICVKLPRGHEQEYYPSVFNVEIKEA